MNSTTYLKKKYAGAANIEIYNMLANEFLDSSNSCYDVVNAIGVMFHIVDDYEWEQTISSISERIKDGGMLVVGGFFGSINNVNVQTDAELKVNKRLRSKSRWIQVLKAAGFSNIVVMRNNSFKYISDTLPENNILVAA